MAFELRSTFAYDIRFVAVYNIQTETFLAYVIKDKLFGILDGTIEDRYSIYLSIITEQTFRYDTIQNMTRTEISNCVNLILVSLLTPNGICMAEPIE